MYATFFKGVMFENMKITGSNTHSHTVHDHTQESKIQMHDITLINM